MRLVKARGFLQGLEHVAFRLGAPVFVKKLRQPEMHFRRVRRIEQQQRATGADGLRSLSQFLGRPRQIAVRLRQQRIDGEETVGVGPDRDPVALIRGQIHESKECVGAVGRPVGPRRATPHRAR